jgi:hypothetical protein
MARREFVTIVDDIDGSEADETVLFSASSGDYEIDLSTVNAEALRRALAPFVQAARKVGKTPAAKAPKSGGKSATVNAAIREWATLRGMPVCAFGRIPGQVVEAYEARTPLERAQDASQEAELAAATT